MSFLVKNCTIADAVNDYQGKYDIYIADGIIKSIERKIDEAANEIIDGSGLTVIPGLIDMHTHLRQPGFEKKETVATGTKAAAKGGYTTVCCMPNTNPVIDNIDTLDMLKNIISENAVVNVYPIAAVTKGQKSIELTDMKNLNSNGAIAFSDDGQPIKDVKFLWDALQLSKKENLFIIEHCEELSLAEGGAINEGKASHRLGLKGISPLSEEIYVMRDIMTAEACKAHIHIAHISTKKSAEIIRQAKSKGIKVTCEVTPHHIGLTEDIISAEFTDCKVNPPLRTSEDVDALKKALVDGTIDVIATDHAPHHIDDKGTDFYKAANGISGIETSFSVCFTELVSSGLLTIRQLVEKLSYNPAKMLNLDSGVIEVGKPADIAMVDLNKEITVDKSNFISMGKNTPFHGKKYIGEVKYTIVNGKIVYTKYTK